IHGLAEGNILLPSAVYISADFLMGLSPQPQPLPCLCSRRACCSCRYSALEKTGTCALFSLRSCAARFSFFIARISGATIMTRADGAPHFDQITAKLILIQTIEQMRFRKKYSRKIILCA